MVFYDYLTNSPMPVTWFASQSKQHRDGNGHMNLNFIATIKFYFAVAFVLDFVNYIEPDNHIARPKLPLMTQ